MIDISKVTDYLYVASRVWKERADELKVLNFNLIISMIGQMERMESTPSLLKPIMHFLLQFQSKNCLLELKRHCLLFKRVVVSQLLLPYIWRFTKHISISVECH